MSMRRNKILPVYLLLHCSTLKQNKTKHPPPQAPEHLFFNAENPFSWCAQPQAAGTPFPKTNAASFTASRLSACDEPSGTRHHSRRYGRGKSNPQRVRSLLNLSCHQCVLHYSQHIPSESVYPLWHIT